MTIIEDKIGEDYRRVIFDKNNWEYRIKNAFFIYPCVAVQRNPIKYGSKNSHRKSYLKNGINKCPVIKYVPINVYHTLIIWVILANMTHFVVSEATSMVNICCQSNLLCIYLLFSNLLLCWGVGSRIYFYSINTCFCIRVFFYLLVNMHMWDTLKICYVHHHYTIHFRSIQFHYKTMYLRLVNTLSNDIQATLHSLLIRHTHIYIEIDWYYMY